MLTISHYVFLSLCIYAVGMLGILLNRKNLIVILMSIEIILLGVNVNLVAFSAAHNNIDGLVFALCVMTVAAAEAAIALALLVIYFRQKATINIDEISELKG